MAIKKKTKLIIAATSTIVVFILAMLGSWTITQQQIQADAIRYFDEDTDISLEKLTNNLEAHTNALYSARGLLTAKSDINQKDWRNFIETNYALERYPYISAIAYVKKVRNSELDQFVSGMNNDDSLEEDIDFEIFPESSEEEHYIVTYYESSDGDQSARGFDLATSPIRKEVMDQAVVTGELAIGEPIELIGDRGRGFHLYLPVYELDNSIMSREDALLGFAMVVIQIDKFIEDLYEESAFRISVNDIDANGMRLYSNYADRFENVISKTATIDVANRSWKFEAWAPNTYKLSTFQMVIPYTILLLGFVGVVTLSILFRLLINKHDN
ncbi:MAG: CHASE domain-containing protein [Candidatus Saccharimonadales bacterium]